MIKSLFVTIFTLFLFFVSGCNSNGKGDCNVVVEVSDMPVDCNLTYQEFVALGKVCDKPNNPPTIVSYESNSTNTITVSENSINITKVLATDLDGDTLTYTLSGVDSKFFIVEDGEVIFKDLPDYENPQDSNTNNIYEVTLIVTDTNGESDSVGFNIKVDDVEETEPLPTPGYEEFKPTPPQTINHSPTITNYEEVNSLEIEENIRDIATIKANDMDGETLSFSLFGSDMDKFNITQSGELSFIVAPSYETLLDSNLDNIYEVIVRVSDSTNFDEAVFLITIKDVEENSIISMEINKEYSVSTGDRVEVLTGDAVINVIHTLDDDTKVITLLSGSANLIRGDYEIKE